MSVNIQRPFKLSSNRLLIFLVFSIIFSRIDAGMNFSSGTDMQTDTSSHPQILTITLYKYLSAEALSKFVKNKSLKLSFGYEANDRFEMLRGDLVPKINMAEQEMSFEAGVRIGFISLTAVKENPYMWGYYSEKYTGARLTLRFKVTKCKERNRYLRQDKPEPRQKELIDIDYARFDGEYIETCEYEVNRLDKIETGLSKCTQNIISNKHISWAGEQEYRILYSINNSRNNALSSLIHTPDVGIYTTSDLNLNIISLDLGPFCRLSASDVAYELEEDEILRSIEIRRLKFVSCMYLTDSKANNNSHEDYILKNKLLVEKLNEEGIYPVAKRNWNSLMSAARRGNYDLLSEIYEEQEHKDIEKEDIYGYNALSLATLARSKSCVNFLLSKGATMEHAKQILKDKALLWAGASGNDVFVHKLLNWGASIKYTDKENMSVLHWAARNGHAKCVQTIIYYISKYSYSGELEKRNSDGCTPLILAAWGKSLETVRCLVGAKADVNAKAYDNSTALIMATRGKQDDDDQDEQIVSFLLDHGAKPSAEENAGHRAVLYAAYLGRTKCLEHLLKAHSISKNDTSQIFSLLTFSIWGMNLSCISSVLSYLMRIIKCEKKTQLASIVCNPDQIDHIMKFYYFFMGNKDSWRIYRLLAEYGFDQFNAQLCIKTCQENPNILMRLAACGQNALLQEILQQDESEQLTQLRDKGGCSALMWAVSDDTLDNVATVETIFKIRGIDGIKDQDKGGCNTIMWAARKGSYRCLCKLIEFIRKREKLDLLTAQDKNGMTALMWAAWKRKKKCLKILLREDNIGMTKQDNQGNTVLDWAVKGGDEECVRLLLKRGAKFGIPDWEKD